MERALRARKFLGVILRECTLETKHGAPSLSDGISEALKETSALFAVWIEQGAIRDEFDPEHLAWEVFAPLVNLRIAYLNPNSTEADVARAKSFASRHVEFFLRAVLKPTSRRSKAPPRLREAK